MAKIPVRQIKASFGSERFSIRSIEPLVKEGVLTHSLHRHDFYFLLLVSKGSGVHEIDFAEYPVAQDTAFFVRPGQVHRLILQPGTCGYMLQFTKEFYVPRSIPDQLVLRKVSSKSYCPLQGDSVPRIFRNAAAIFEEATQRSAHFREAIQAYLQLLFLDISRQTERPMKSVKDTAGYLQERLEELQELLEANITAKKQVSQYAEMMHLSSYQINQITKTLLQKTCSRIIDEHIILEAKRMLIATADQVSRIADHLGYEDTSYFIRFFKKQTGQTPDNFRRNFK